MFTKLTPVATLADLVEGLFVGEWMSFLTKPMPMIEPIMQLVKSYLR